EKNIQLEHCQLQFNGTALPPRPNGLVVLKKMHPAPDTWREYGAISRDARVLPFAFCLLPFAFCLFN
ncbi:MAG: hypothetical protein AABY83_11125, partial [Pseudomonadota bacterium]